MEEDAASPHEVSATSIAGDMMSAVIEWPLAAVVAGVGLGYDGLIHGISAAKMLVRWPGAVSTEPSDEELDEREEASQVNWRHNVLVGRSRGGEITDKGVNFLGGLEAVLSPLPPLPEWRRHRRSGGDGGGSGGIRGPMDEAQRVEFVAAGVATQLDAPFPGALQAAQRKLKEGLVTKAEYAELLRGQQRAVRLLGGPSDDA
jgi:hypothetical protein